MKNNKNKDVMTLIENYSLLQPSLCKHEETSTQSSNHPNSWVSSHSASFTLTGNIFR